MLYKLNFVFMYRKTHFIFGICECSILKKVKNRLVKLISFMIIFCASVANILNFSYYTKGNTNTKYLKNLPTTIKKVTFQNGTRKKPSAIVIGSPMIGTQEKKANQ